MFGRAKIVKLIFWKSEEFSLADEYSERKLEQQRVDWTIQQIDAQIKKTQAALDSAHQETRAVEKNFGENASINRYEVDDIAESRSELEQQRQLVARTVENETILRHQLQTLQQLRESPYFGRIDILDPGEKEPESLYIGTASLMNDDKTDFIVYDWRAPISGIYYNGTLGKVQYQTPAGTQSTTLVKKRQFTIKNGQIINMFDTNETVGDQMLQEALGHQNDQYMQNIVATIQKEQNDIIRDTKSDLLLVQGVAGSGKTSAILQRIAYLLYHSRTALNADQIVLFSPNLLFSHYISDVLPSLGERNMRQVTLEGFLRRRFEGLNVESLFERYETRSQNPAISLDIANYLEGADCMHQVKAYLEFLQQHPDAICFTDLNFRQQPFFSAAHIQSIYQAQPAAMTIADRLLKTKNALIKELKSRIQDVAKSDWIAKELNDQDVIGLHNLYGQKTIDDFADEDEQYAYLSYQLAKKRLRIVYDAIYNDYFIDFNSQYEKFLQQLSRPAAVKNSDWQSMLFGYRQQLEYHRIALMHTAPLMYLRDLMSGSGQNRSFQYVFIDEMQDYSLAMLIYLKHAFPKARFTILGDSEQALFKPLQLPGQLLQQLNDALAFKHPNLIELKRSYRSTMEITDFAKSLLPDGDQIISFTRHGAKPRLITAADSADAATALLQQTAILHERYATIAVLTKDRAQAKQVYQTLHRQFKSIVHLLDSQDSVLPVGIVVLPIYLAKGLEFDAAIAWNVSDQNLPAERAVGLIYTMASRAMHELTLISAGPVSSVIEQNAAQLLETAES